jgi:hypothetical protein
MIIETSTGENIDTGNTPDLLDLLKDDVSLYASFSSRKSHQRCLEQKEV